MCNLDVEILGLGGQLTAADPEALTGQHDLAICLEGNAAGLVVTPDKVGGNQAPDAEGQVEGKDLAAEFIHKPDTGTTLVANTDRREPAKASAITDFSDEL